MFFGVEDACYGSIYRFAYNNHKRWIFCGVGGRRIFCALQPQANIYMYEVI